MQYHAYPHGFAEVRVASRSDRNLGQDKATLPAVLMFKIWDTTEQSTVWVYVPEEAVIKARALV